MATAIAMPVYDLLTVPATGNSAKGFGLFFYPSVNGADGVMQRTNVAHRPEWIITGPFPAKLGRHDKVEGVEIKHLEAKRDKVIVNHSYVYDRAGFIAIKYSGTPVEETQALTRKDAIAAMRPRSIEDSRSDENDLVFG